MVRDHIRNHLFSSAVTALVILMIMPSGRAQMNTDQRFAGPHAISSMTRRGTGTHTAVRQFRTLTHGAAVVGPIPPDFLPVVTYGSGGWSPDSVAVGDLNGDGHPDIVVTNQCEISGCAEPRHGVLSVLIGNGDGTFKPAVNYESGAYTANSIAISDFNGDHKLDIAVANCYPDTCQTVGVLLGNGDGTFQVAVNYDSGGPGTYSVVVSDVNGDGKPDLVVTNINAYYPVTRGSSVGILLGNGDGSFQHAVTYDSGGDGAYGLAVDDINNDSKPDIIVVDMWAADPADPKSYIGVLLNNGNGTFHSAVTYESGGYASESVAIGDLNRDSRPDLVVFSDDDTVGSCTSGLVTVLLGKGDGTFQSAVPYSSVSPCAFSGATIGMGDINGDGKQDVLEAVTGQTGSRLGVLVGKGDGTLQAVVGYDAGGSFPSGVAVSDLNGDARPDVVVSECGIPGCQAETGDLVGVFLHIGSVRTTTIISSSLTPSTFGQPVTFSATVTSGSGTPTGAIGFFDRSALLGATTLVNGTASMSFSSLGTGSHSITAVYQGSLKYKSSASSPLAQVVDVGTTVTSVVSTRNPVPVKLAVTYTATVAGQYGGAATGTATFQEGDSTIAVLPLSGNQAAYRIAYSSIGIHPITVAYSGDANNLGSVSPPVTEYVEYTTNATVMTSGSPSLVGQPVTFTATITSKNGMVPNGELVTFYDETVVMGAGALLGGKATYTTSALSAKGHSIKAVYGGDGIFMPSSTAVKQLVVKYATITALTSAPNPSNFGQLVTYTATVTSAGPTPTGKVKFLDGTLGIGTAILNGGVAKLSKSTLAVGTHAITAQYLGDSASATSTSSVLNQVVR